MRDRIARWAASKQYMELREMFGLSTFLYLGNFLAADDDGDLVVRLAPDDDAEARRLPGAKPWRAGGPGTAVYTRIPADQLADDEALHAWLEKALTYSQTLEPKERLLNKAVLRPAFLDES